MIVPLLHQWTKANALFKPPVINQCRTIELKLTKLWHKACSIQLCSESNCSHSGKRENNSHIDCGCPREKKIPVLELEFIKAQRTKAEGQGSMQMGSIDYSETKKQIANAKKREQIREREQKKNEEKVPPINVNATKLSELVDLSLEVLEPPLTTSQELRNLKETPMQVPKCGEMCENGHRSSGPCLQPLEAR
ncbi:putative leucine zipper transcription factor-like protein 1-like 9, partial [Homarus americanus]